jgi:hypothetical protein
VLLPLYWCLLGGEPPQLLSCTWTLLDYTAGVGFRSGPVIMEPMDGWRERIRDFCLPPSFLAESPAGRPAGACKRDSEQLL